MTELVRRLHKPRFEGLGSGLYAGYFYDTRTEQGDTGTQDNWRYGNDHLIDQAGVEQDGVQLTATHQPDTPAVGLLQLPDKIRRVFGNVVDMGCIGLRRPAEYVVGLVLIWKRTAETQNRLIRSVSHEGRIDRLYERTVAIIELIGVWHSVEPVDAAIGAGNEPVERRSNVKAEFAHG